MPSITLDPRIAIGAAPTVLVSRRTRRGNAVLPVQCAIVLLLATAGLLASALRLDAEQLLYPACLIVTALFLWILGSWYWLRRTLFEPYPLFMLAAGLFNAGQAFLELFGWNPAGILKGRVSPDILTPALYLVTISAACLHAGALVAHRMERPRGGMSELHARCRATCLAGWCLLAVAVVPTYVLLRSSFSLVLDHGYMSLFRNADSFSTAIAVSAFLVPGIIFLLAGSVAHRGIQAFCIIATIGYAAAYLFLGARGSAAMVCVAAAWVYDRSIRRIPRPLILLFAIAAMTIFPLVRETRLTGGRYRLSLDDQLQTLSSLENPVSSSISEMGQSLVTVTHTLTLVPESRSFDYGASYLYGLAAVIPNFGWKLHPTVQHGLLSEWLVRTVDPFIAAAGGGLGFSFIAEAYLNFGWFGGPVWLGFVGFGLSRLFLKADCADPASHAFAASFLAFFFVFARGESAIVARGLVWYAVLPYLLVTLLSTRSRRKMERP